MPKALYKFVNRIFNNISQYINLKKKQICIIFRITDLILLSIVHNIFSAVHIFSKCESPFSYFEMLNSQLSNTFPVNRQNR